MRDLKADLTLCEKATPGPWYRERTGETYKGFAKEVLIADTASCCTGNKVWATTGSSFSADDADFIAAAREGWPEAIRRAMAAEKERDELRVVLKDLTDAVDRAISKSGKLPALGEWVALIGRARRALNQ